MMQAAALPLLQEFVFIMPPVLALSLLAVPFVKLSI